MDNVQIRKDTAGCEDIIHLNNAGAALMPVSVANAIRGYITIEEHMGGYEAANANREKIDDFYEYAARLLHCNSRNIAFTNSATDSYNRALSAIPFQKGDVVLLTENDYPSNFLAFISLKKRFDIELIQVKNSPGGEIDLEDMEAKLKQYQPRLLSVSHIPTSSGLIQPLAEIAELIKNQETIFLLDACQSMGQIELDAVKSHAHFVSGTFRKFLRGPRGAGILYVSDKALESGLEPLFIDMRGAEWIDDYAYVARPDAKRFEDWETAYALMMGATEAIRYALEVGIANIEARNQELISYLKKELIKLPGIQLQDRGSRQCSIVTFSIENTNEVELKKYLYGNGINISTTPRAAAIIDFREKGIDWVARVSPHYYNTEAEIDRLISVLKGI